MSNLGTRLDKVRASGMKPDSSSLFGVDTLVWAISPSGVTALIQPQSNTFQTWQVKADKSDIQQATRLIGTLKSTDEKGALELQCKDAETQVHVSTDAFLSWDPVNVLYRTGRNSPVQNRWSVSRGGRGAIANDAMAFVNALPDGATLDMRRITAVSITTLQFNLGNISSLRSQLATVCHR